MSIYTDVTKVPGYDQTRYEALISQARAEGVKRAVVDKQLLDAVNNTGKNFADAASVVSSQIPELKKPVSAAMVALNDWKAAPAPGAIIMALITQITSENRQQNKELMWAQTEAIASSIEKQADEMRTMAVVQAVVGVCGLVAGVAGGIKGGNATGLGMGLGATSQIASSVSQSLGTYYQANIKVMEADQEKMRAMRDSVKDLNDGLRDLIQKTLSGTDSIQQGKNQAMGRILA